MLLLLICISLLTPYPSTVLSKRVLWAYDLGAYDNSTAGFVGGTLRQCWQDSGFKYALSKFRNQSEKVYSALPAHWSAAVEVDVIPLYSWDNERLIVKVQGTPFLDVPTSFSTLKADGPMCLQDSSNSWRPRYDVYPLLFNLSHSASTLNLTVAHTLDQSQDDEDLAFREVRVFLDLCHPSCASCTNASHCTPPSACNSSQYLYKGACVSACPQEHFGSAGLCHDCPANCKACTDSTFCTECLAGNYYLLNGKCTSQCPMKTTALESPLKMCEDPLFSNSTAFSTSLPFFLLVIHIYIYNSMQKSLCWTN